MAGDLARVAVVTAQPGYMLAPMSRARREKKHAADAVKAVRRERPLTGDIFGIEREAILHQSNVRNIFTPHQPVSETDLLYGRQTEMRKMLETLNTPGQHVLLFGERGVGKSSLANVVSLAVRITTSKQHFVKRCDTSDNFVSIVRAPLAAVGAELTLQQVSSKQVRGGHAEVAPWILKFGRQKSDEHQSTYEANGALSPSTVAEAIADLDALLVIDEADAIQGSEDRKRLAELIKLLSDSGSALKVMVVGIAGTADELTAAHPSVQRCLKETQLERMSDGEIREIVESGAAALGLHFTPAVVGSIVSLSAGYPHFTHLLSLKCAEDAIVDARREVAPDHLRKALLEAVSDAEGTLRRIYDDSVRSTSTAYRDILMAAAALGPREFSAVGLRDSYASLTGSPISQGSLNNYLAQRLISRDGSTVLRRTGQGHYRFEDPRMSSFVRIANQMI